VTIAIAIKLLAVLVTAALGYAAGRLRWLTAGAPGSDAARVLSNLAFYVFIPALLFRTTARLDFATMPWRTVAAYFVPVIGVLLLVYASQRFRGSAAVAPALPSVRAISTVFGNTVQLGIPFAAALYGEEGLAIHIPLISVHALLILTLVTVLAELDVARAGGASSLVATLLNTAHHTLVHPVLRGHLRGATAVTLGKLIVLPAVVLVVAHWGFGLEGVPLAVLVMMAALPVGSNALLFAQRYGTLEAEATAATVASTVAFVATAALWLAVLALL
jgi:malonate transporter and related proteins